MNTMTHYLMHLVATLAVFTFTASAFTQSEELPKQVVEVTFPDANLEAGIREVLGLPIDAILSSQLTAIHQLYLPSRGIANLSGMEWLTELRELRMGGNQISNLTPIGNLPHLREVEMASNALTTLAPLANRVTLTKLNVANNSITSLVPLANLVNLTELNLSLNQVSSLSPLSNLVRLRQLALAFNNLSFIAPLANHSQLEELDITGNGVSNLTPLSGLSNLRTLFAYGNRISDLSPIADLPNLSTILVARNQLTALPIFTGSNPVFILNLDDNGVTDLQPLLDSPRYQNATSIQYIGVQNNPLCEEVCLVQIPELSRRGYQVITSGGCTEVFCTVVAVDIPDAALEAALRQELGVAAGPITNQMLLSVRELDLSAYRNIRDLTGLEHCLYLERLNISNNEVSDLSPLVELGRLWVLLAADNLISDMSQFENRYFDILDLSRNRMSDLRSMRRISVDNLYLAGNEIETILPLVDFNVYSVLDLSDNEIQSLSPLRYIRFYNIHTLQLNNNRIRDVDPIRQAQPRHLVRLYLSGNEISDLSPLNALFNANSHTQGSSRLTFLEANDNQIRDLEGANFDRAISLSLSRNQITDLQPLAGSPWLRYLALSGNQITDLSPLASVTTLYGLYLDTNAITDLSPLAGMVELGRLVLATNQIADISPLSGLKSLYALDINANQVTSLQPLVGNRGLGANDVVDVRNNALAFSTCSSQLAALRSRGVALLDDGCSIPEARCRENLTVGLSEGSLSGEALDAGSTDPGGGALTFAIAKSFSAAAGVYPESYPLTCQDVANSPVQLLMRVSNGLRASECVVAVNIVDDVQPVVAARNFALALDASGTAALDAADVDRGSNDNCTESPALSLSKSTFTCADIGNNAVVFTVTDEAGNTAETTITVTVVDSMGICPVAEGEGEEGEGATEGATEGAIEGSVEGSAEGGDEGELEGDGEIEGEGGDEGEGEGEVPPPPFGCSCEPDKLNPASWGDLFLAAMLMLALFASTLTIRREMRTA